MSDPDTIDTTSRMTLRRILCAPDSFKETLAAADVAHAMSEGIAEFDRRIDVDRCPVADGGEGSLDALAAALAAEITIQTVTGPLAQPVSARYGLIESSRTAIVELAEASGLALLAPDDRNPMRTTTYGTGQLIAAAIERGCQRIMVCVGGSATVDGGAGLAQALGARFFDAQDQLIDDPMTGAHLSRVCRCEPAAVEASIEVACDVRNPLLGPTGAARVYGPQKGASPSDVEQLEEGLRNLANVVSGDPDERGAGASGGAAFGLAAFCSAKLRPGVDVILSAVNFNQRCDEADLVLTGEGRLDAQSLHGKTPIGVARAAHDCGVPTDAIVGRAGVGADACLDPHQGGYLRAILSLVERFGERESIENTAECVRRGTLALLRERVA